MRWIVFILIALLAAWFFLPDPEPVPVEETFIAEPVNALRKAEAFEDTHLEQAEERKKRMEEAVDGGG